MSFLLLSVIFPINEIKFLRYALIKHVLQLLVALLSLFILSDELFFGAKLSVICLEKYVNHICKCYQTFQYTGKYRKPFITIFIKSSVRDA